MNDFKFRLAAGTSLHETSDGWYLLSHRPVRALKLNRTLYRLLAHVRDGGSPGDFARGTGQDEGRLLATLLSLVSRGYLELVSIPQIDECPKVSVIIPVRDQPDDLLECLESLERMDYPGGRLEIIVVDDGSEREVAPLVFGRNVRVIRRDEPHGPAAGRNAGAEQAGGEFLAFLDADCMAGEKWLAELLPFFRAGGVAAVGGYVDGYYQASFLDRYERASSSLNMGKRLLLEGKSSSTFYVPTANLLVSSEAFRAAGGFREGMWVGEDVDFCWRLREMGHNLLYFPYGKVAHKHRNRATRMLKRRAEYGTSEATLYREHREKKKAFLVSLYAGLSFLAAALALMWWNPYPLIALPLLFAIDAWRKGRSLSRFGPAFKARQILAATARSYLSFFYFAFFHLVRYYLVLLVGLGFLLGTVWAFAGLALFYTSVVDFAVRRPALPYPVFLWFYTLEHLAYQLGVFWGCLRRGYFGSYLVSFRRA